MYTCMHRAYWSSGEPTLVDTHIGEDDCWCWNISLSTEEFGPSETAYKSGRLRKSTSTDSFERLS